MASDDEDNGSYARLTELGLLHLRDKPEELLKALQALGQKRQGAEAAWELEAAKIRAKNAAPPPAKPNQVKAPAPAPAPQAPPKATGPRRKSSTLLTLTRTPGRCADCRHLNHGTTDHREGLYFCQMAHARKEGDQRCDVKQQFPASPADQKLSPKKWPTYYFYEPHDGTNCTYERLEDSRLLLEDASPESKKAAKADQPFIPGE